MSHRIRTLATVVAIVAASLLATPSAHAGPSPRQPASQRVTEVDAHRTAAFAVSRYLAQPLPGPRSSKVGRCHGGPRVWRCPSTASGRDTSCTTTVVVWSDGDDFYAEFNQLRCSSPPS